MSKYVQTTTVFTEQEHLVGALSDMGYSALVYATNEPPEHLYGYHGDKRPETANIIVRRQQISSAANDIGFVLRDGVYQAIISEFDSHRHNKTWVGKLAQCYSERRTQAVAVARGYRFVSKEIIDGKVKLQFAVR
jgi:hypothetical protein